jgi:uncharacterized protein (TIGR03084 family)
MAVGMAELLSDLAAETEVVEELLAGLHAGDWDRPTPAHGWAIRDQVSHLAYFDGIAVLALREPDGFQATKAELTAIGDEFVDHVAQRYRSMRADELANWFRSARRRLITEFDSADPAAKLPWFGPSMSAASSVTARLMETWAHGQDIADALGRRTGATDRLRHIAHIGVRAMPFSFQLRGLPVPDESLYVELAAPGGGTWSWGAPDGENQVHGPAEDFCLVVTQRRNIADTAVRTKGAVAARWMSIAQAYAGPPGSGRPVGENPRATAGRR